MAAFLKVGLSPWHPTQSLQDLAAAPAAEHRSFPGRGSRAHMCFWCCASRDGGLLCFHIGLPR
eukprot:1913995-Pyramimonas_sp.AAC.1